MASTSIKLKGWKQYSDKLKAAPQKVVKVMNAHAAIASNNIANDARTNSPHNLGRLRGSIHANELKPGQWSVTVGVNYAAYMEFGTKSKVQIPSGLEQYASQFRGGGGEKGAKEAIYQWCQDQGIERDRWWGIFIHIMLKGVRAHPFLFPAVERERPKFYNRLKDALNNI